MGTLQGNQILQRPFVDVKQAVNTREESLNKKKKKNLPKMTTLSPAIAPRIKDRRQKVGLRLGWQFFLFYFIFMVVGTQDKGHKVSNVQVMPLSLGALPSEEVPRCQTAAYTGAAGENPRGDINKEQRRASGELFFFFFLSRAIKSAKGDFWQRPLRGIFLSERYRYDNGQY